MDTVEKLQYTRTIHSQRRENARQMNKKKSKQKQQHALAEDVIQFIGEPDQMKLLEFWVHVLQLLKTLNFPTFQLQRIYVKLVK